MKVKIAWPYDIEAEEGVAVLYQNQLIGVITEVGEDEITVQLDDDNPLVAWLNSELVDVKDFSLEEGE